MVCGDYDAMIVINDFVRNRRNWLPQLNKIKPIDRVTGITVRIRLYVCRVSLRERIVVSQQLTSYSILVQNVLVVNHFTITNNYLLITLFNGRLN